MALIKIGEKYEYLKDVLLSLLLTGIAFIINAGISIRGLYMDDLLMWSTRRGTGFFKYVFPHEMIYSTDKYTYRCRYCNSSLFFCKETGKLKDNSIFTGFNVSCVKIFIL